MNARTVKARREAEEQEFRAKVLGLVEAQKGVIGALARGLTDARKDIEDLKRTRETVQHDHNCGNMTSGDGCDCGAESAEEK